MSLDPVTVQLLTHHIEEMDVEQAGAQIGEEAFVFSLEADCSKPTRPDYMTRRTRQLRRQLGLENVPYDATILAMRRFTSTELIDAGFNPSLVSGRQGHTVQVMLHYSKARESADRGAKAGTFSVLEPPPTIEPVLFVEPHLFGHDHPST